MSADMWTFLLALWLMCLSSKGQQPDGLPQKEFCKLYPVTAPLGSSVILPCMFPTNGLKSVSWVHLTEPNQDSDLVSFSSNERVNFLDPRHGRVKAFPIQASVGNFSIRIDEVKLSDLGSYICSQDSSCFQVVLHNDKGEQFDEESYEDFCEKHTLRAPLGSSVLLPCNFPTNVQKAITWAYLDAAFLGPLSFDGHVKFIDHRYGRVKAFPYLASSGNFSIRIDELKLSDLGSYTCRQRNKCFQVDLLEEKSTLDANTQHLIYICVGVAAAILLSTFGYLCYMKCRGLWDKRRTDNANNTVNENTGGQQNFQAPSAPPVEPRHQHQPGSYDNNLVYENDDQQVVNTDPRNQSAPTGYPQHPDGSQPSQSNTGIYPNLEEFKRERGESQRRRFHIELISRLRPASLSRHYYANQRELNKQQAMAKRENQRARKAKTTVPISDCEYKNPIYNRSTEQLNRL